MTRFDAIQRFYRTHLPDARKVGTILEAPCPVCAQSEDPAGGTLTVKTRLERMLREFTFTSIAATLPAEALA